MKCNRLRRHNDARHAQKQLELPSSFADEADREIIVLPRWCALLSYCCCALPRTHTQTLPHLRPSRPISHFATQLHFLTLHHKLHCASASAQATLIASFSSRIPSTSLLGNICFQEHHSNSRILHHSHYATNLHPGAHQDYQKTLVRHAS